MEDSVCSHRITCAIVLPEQQQTVYLNLIFGKSMRNCMSGIWLRRSNSSSTQPSSELKPLLPDLKTPPSCPLLLDTSRTQQRLPSISSIQRLISLLWSPRCQTSCVGNLERWPTDSRHAPLPAWSTIHFCWSRMLPCWERMLPQLPESCTETKQVRVSYSLLDHPLIAYLSVSLNTPFNIVLRVEFNQEWPLVFQLCHNNLSSMTHHSSRKCFPKLW